MWKLVSDYQNCLSDGRYRLSTFAALVFFAFSIVIAGMAISFSGTYASNSVTDLVLSNTPVYNVDGIFVYGGVLMVVFSTLIILLHPKRLPFAVKSVALFYLIRSGFVVLTHISPYPEHVAITNSYFTTSVLFRTFFTGDDLFFSAHTGLPLMLAFIFWDSPALRYAFIAASLIFGAVVLLGHLHYSIDVAAAFFIVPTIYRLSRCFFRNDYAGRAIETA